MRKLLFCAYETLVFPRRNCLLLYVNLLSCISNLNAQVFKLENGLAFSKLQTKGVKGANIDLYPHKLTTYQISLDIEYLQTKHFYLSSSIGYLEKGGKYTDIVNQSMSERHINQYITIQNKEILNILITNFYVITKITG